MLLADLNDRTSLLLKITEKHSIKLLHLNILKIFHPKRYLTSTRILESGMELIILYSRRILINIPK